MTTNLPAAAQQRALDAAQQRELLRQKVLARKAEGAAPSVSYSGALYMRFNGNDGSLTLGKNNQSIPADQLFVVPLEGIKWGYIEWVSKRPSGQERMIKMVDGHMPSPPAGVLMKGSKPKRAMDGWGECIVVELHGMNGELDGIRCEWPMHSQGGQEAARKLAAGMFDRMEADLAHVNVIVKLRTDSYFNKEYSRTVYYPVFDVVGHTDGLSVSWVQDEASEAASVLD